MILLVNFIFLYIISGIILTAQIKKLPSFFSESGLSYFVGFGISPFFISIILYYLYLFAPGREWFFYSSIIYIVYLFILISNITETKKVIVDSTKFLANLLSKIVSLLKSSALPNKLYISFVLFVVLFVFVKGLAYPFTWPDMSSYLEQGYILTNNRSLNSLVDRDPLCEGTSCFQVNPAVCPAIPLLQSFLYHKAENFYDNSFRGIRFVYFYYFFLSLCIFIYIFLEINNNRELLLLGLTLWLSSYSFSHLMIFGFKEIIYIFIILANLYIIYLLNIKKETNVNLSFFSIIIGALLGIGIFLNFDGVIIAGIILLILLFSGKKTNFSIKNKSISLALISLLIILFGGRVLYTETSQFIFNKGLISNGNRTETFFSKSNELEGHSITEEKIDEKQNQGKILSEILMKGKLQSFTQPQFHGLIFFLFLFSLIFYIKDKKGRNLFISIIGFFVLLYSFVIRDPFFLNPHRYAYVLAISQKYTTLLIPLASVFVAYNYSLVYKFLIKYKYLKYISIFSIFIIPSIRNHAVHVLYDVIRKASPLQNPKIYYLDRLNILLLYFPLFSLISFSVLLYLEKYKRKTESERKVFQNLIFISLFFIIPYTITLNNNQSIGGTITHIFSSDIDKLRTYPADADKKLYKMIDFVNKNIDLNKKILVVPGAKGFPNSRKSKRFTYNPDRIMRSEDLKTMLEPDQQPESIFQPDYILTDSEDANILIEDFGKKYILIHDMDDLALLKVK